MLRHRTAWWAMCALLNGAMLIAQSDPGPRPGPPAAGRPLQGLTPAENATFQEGASRFQEIDAVANGLGPRFNLNSCSACHSQPALGGSSPSLHSPQNPQPNPQIAVASLAGATNTVPSFVQPDGPVMAARFVRKPDGTPDGGVHSLFVISGRSDAGNCAIAQPDFATALAQNNIAFRIPVPLFGAGLVEAIPDGAILANKAANAGPKVALGIAGHENRSSNDGTITRFGWKAQNKSLEIFAGEAYNVEVGVTNTLFPNERDPDPSCALNPQPEDQPDFTAATPVAGMSDVQGFSAFMRWLAPPAPPQLNPSAQHGQQVFNQVGCPLCHTPMMTTGTTTSAALNHRPVPLYSDLLVHRMGSALADGITQGMARGDEFRTAPLWGLGQRIYLLHDGRTVDLMQAIAAHSSNGSEANGVIAAFNALPASAIQDLLDFLRSL